MQRVLAISLKCISQGRPMKQLAGILILLAMTGCESKPQGPADDGRRAQIETLYKDNETKVADAELKEYLRDYPRDDKAWILLGESWEHKGFMNETAPGYFNEPYYVEAKKAYESALAINPKNFQALNALASVQQILGNYAQAIEVYEKTVEIDPTYAHGYSSMWELAHKLEQKEKAMEYARKAYAVDKSDPTLTANMAVAYHYDGDFENRDKFTKMAEEMGYDTKYMLEIYEKESLEKDQVKLSPIGRSTGILPPAE